MHVMIGGKEVEVEISPTGVFFDKATKQFSAQTLKGLQKKIIKSRPNGGGIDFISPQGKKGRVTGRKGGRGYTRNYYHVVWEDGSVSDLHSVQIAASPAEKIEQERLQKIVQAKQAEVNAANSVAYQYAARFDITKQLNI